MKTEIRTDRGWPQRRLGYVFEDKSLLRDALTLPCADSRSRYELLEHFGDRIVGACVTECLMQAYQSDSEGPIANMQGRMVSNKNLASIAVRLKLVPFINWGKRRVHVEPKMLGSVVEAIIGAIKEDGGYEAAREVCWRLFQLDMFLMQIQDPSEQLLARVDGLNGRIKYSTYARKRRPNDPFPGYVADVEIGGKPIVKGVHGYDVDSATKNAAALAMLTMWPELDRSSLGLDPKDIRWDFK